MALVVRETVPPLPTQMVEGFAARNPIRPCSEEPWLRQPRDLSRDRDQHILHDIVNVIGSDQSTDISMQ